MLKYAYNIADNMLHGIRDNIYLLSKKRIGSFIRQIHVIIKHDQGKL